MSTNHTISPFTLITSSVISPFIVSASDDPLHPIEIRIGTPGHNPRYATVSQSQARAIAYALLAHAEPHTPKQEDQRVGLQ